MSLKTIGGPAAVLLALAVAASAASAGQYFKPLTAGTKTPAGQAFGTSLRLPLRTDQFQQISRPSSSSITLGYPKTTLVTRRGKRVKVRAKPCARVTFKLSIAAGQGDPLALVRAAVPTADLEGTETYTSTTSAVGDTVPRRAWRIASSIVNSSLLQESGTSIEQLNPADPYGPLVPALRTITMAGRMVHATLPCGGANSFTLGPGVASVIQDG